MSFLTTLGKAASRLVAPRRRSLARANPVATLLSDSYQQRFGMGDDWSPSSYGDYLAISPTVYACVHLRARNLSRVRLRLYRSTEGGATVPLPDTHPAQLLLDSVNPFWSRQRFWYMVEASLSLWGSAPVVLFRDGRGNVRELWWLRPSRFKVIPDASAYIKGYLYTKDGVDVAFGPEDVLWFRYPNPIEEYAGLSPIAALRMSIDTNTDAIRFNRRFFRNDATPGRVYLKSEQELTTAQAEELRMRWEVAFKDPNRAHSIAILDKSADLKSLAVSQRDMEYVEGQRFTKEEICGAYGVSPLLIGDLRFSSFANFTLAKSSFWDETLIPEMQLIESELSRGLVPLLGDGLQVRFDVGDVSALREDARGPALSAAGGGRHPHHQRGSGARGPRARGLGRRMARGPGARRGHPAKSRRRSNPPRAPRGRGRGGRMTANRGWFPIEARGKTGGRHRVRIMTGERARDGDVVEPMGMRVENYLKNPVVMWVHDYVGRTPSAGLPIGRTLGLDRRAEGIDVEFEFLPGDPFAGRVENAWERGFLCTASIGWESLEARPLPNGRGVRHSKSELLEWSLVPIPADPGASRELFVAGMRSLGFADLLGDETERGAPAWAGLEHPPLGRLVAELEDAWDYVKARVAAQGVSSNRLRGNLAQVARGIEGVLEQGTGKQGTERESGDDTADAIDQAALLLAAEQILRTLEELQSGVGPDGRPLQHEQGEFYGL